jgi:hypothetical protein
MKASQEQSSPTITGTVTVIVSTIVPGLLIAFGAAYLNDDPAVGFQREGIFHDFLVIVGTQTLCNLAGYLLTVPVYHLCRLPHTKPAIVTHAVFGTLLATVSYYSGLPAKLQSLLPTGVLSDSGLVELLLITALSAALPYLLVAVILGVLIKSRE